MINFQIDEERPDLIKAIRTLKDLAGGEKIIVRQILLVSTGDENLAEIIRCMLPPAPPIIQSIEGAKIFIRDVQRRVDERLGTGPAEAENKPRIAIKGNGHRPANVATEGKLEMKACPACGLNFMPKSKKQVYCDFPECKKARRKAEQDRWLAKKNGEKMTKPAVTSLVPPMEVSPGPDPLAGDLGPDEFRVLSGDLEGNILNPIGLKVALEEGNLFPGAILIQAGGNRLMVASRSRTNVLVPAGGFVAAETLLAMRPGME